MKRQERKRRKSPLSPVEALEGRSLMTMAATVPLPDVALPAGAVVPVDLKSHFQDPDAKPDFAVFDTTLGTIPVLLTPATTPKTVANFLNYVNKGSYTNAIVHRSVPGFIWQTGGYQLSSAPSITPIAADPPVPNEFGASNTRGTIAMAKLGNDPNSATSQFFFNESDSNASNLDNQNGGFTVFGRVIGDAGLAVMDAVARVDVPARGPFASPLDDIPLLNYTPGTTVQPSNLVLIKGVTTASEVFVAASDNPNVASATVQGGTLTVTPLAAGTAQITVVGYGSDGIPAADTFSVTVSPSAVTPPPATPGDPPPVFPPTTTPPPTTPPTTTLPPTTPPSVLIPSARGALPASAVAGRVARIQQVVTLRNGPAPIAQKQKITLSLSRDAAGSPDDITIASSAKMVRLKGGQRARLTLAAKRLPATVPAGTYRVLVSVTDPDGAKTTIDTGKSLVVRPASSRA